MMQNTSKGRSSGGTGEGLFALVALAMVAIAIGLALLLVRTPWNERAWRQDLAKVRHLERLANAIDCYRVQNNTLPKVLNALVGLRTDTPERKTICGRATPIHDQAMVEELCRGCSYRVLADDRYEICAEFKADMSKAGYGNKGPVRDRLPGLRDWRHKPGRACFSLKPREGR